jgi:hypothetical protein
MEKKKINKNNGKSHLRYKTFYSVRNITQNSAYGKSICKKWYYSPQGKFGSFPAGGKGEGYHTSGP